MMALLAQLRSGLARTVSNPSPVDIGRNRAARGIKLPGEVEDPASPSWKASEQHTSYSVISDRLERIVNNLIQNAQDATLDESPVRVIRLEESWIIRPSLDRHADKGIGNERGLRARPVVQAIPEYEGGRHGHRGLRRRSQYVQRARRPASRCRPPRVKERPFECYLPKAGRGARGIRFIGASTQTCHGRRVMERRRPLLIVEDDPALQKQLRWAFDHLSAGHRERSRTGHGQVAAGGAGGRDHGSGTAAETG